VAKEEGLEREEFLKEGKFILKKYFHTIE